MSPPLIGNPSLRERLLPANLRTRVLAAITVASVSLPLNIHAKQIDPPKGWEAEMTHIRRPRQANVLAEFGIEERLQRAAASSNRSVLVFPEGTVRRWTDATAVFWTAALAGTPKALIIGAVEPISGSADYYNSVVILQSDQRRAVHQRIPVPGGMWNPLKPKSFALNLFDTGVAVVDGERVAVLICYEQLLVWPMLRSAVEKPALLIAVSNEDWTEGTGIPSVQHACVRAWARLFGLPVITAINS
jgi:apolipoprotein N-acyltransferase